MTDLRESKLASVIGRFYEAAAQPDLWRDVLHEASLAVGAHGAALFAHPKSEAATAGGPHSEGLDELCDAFVREGWYLKRHPRNSPRFRQCPWALHTEQTIFTPEEFETLPFNAAFLSRFGLRWFVRTTLADTDQVSVTVSFERKAKDQPFSADELRALESLLPHLHRAGSLAVHFGRSRGEGILDAFEHMGCGGVLIDALGRVIRMNTRAQHHLDQGLTLAHGHLLASHRGANAGLQRLIASVLQPGPAHEAPTCPAVAIPRRAGRPLIAHVAPVVGSAGDVFQSAKAVLLLVDPDEPRAPAAILLREAFGLTASEARVAADLARGLELQEIAATYRLSLGTVRMQLKSIFAKTDVHRQSDLVGLLIRMGIGLGSN